MNTLNSLSGFDGSIETLTAQWQAGWYCWVYLPTTSFCFDNMFASLLQERFRIGGFSEGVENYESSSYS